eukprot:scaffold110_cov315-Pavlova_lutheri.AAC.12
MRRRGQTKCNKILGEIWAEPPKIGDDGRRGGAGAVRTMDRTPLRVVSDENPSIRTSCAEG